MDEVDGPAEPGHAGGGVHQGPPEVGAQFARDEGSGGLALSAVLAFVRRRLGPSRLGQSGPPHQSVAPLACFLSGIPNLRLRFDNDDVRVGRLCRAGALARRSWDRARTHRAHQRAPSHRRRPPQRLGRSPRGPRLGLAGRHRGVLRGRGGGVRGVVLRSFLLGDRHSLDAHDGALAAHDSGRGRRDRADGRAHRRPLWRDPRLGHDRLYRGRDPDRVGHAGLWRRSVRRAAGSGQRASARDRVAAAATARARKARGLGRRSRRRTARRRRN